MKKLLSIIISLAMLMSVLSAGFSAYAEETYGLWVNGSQFSDENLSIDCGEGTAVYAPETNTLTLNNASISVSYEFEPWYEAMIYSELSELNIVLEGSSVLESTNTNADGIDAAGGCDVIISGGGSLAINNAYYGTYIGNWEVAGGNLTVKDGATLTVTNSQCASIWVNHDITFLDCAVTVTKTTTYYDGIVANQNSTITVNGATLNITNYHSAIHFGNGDETYHAFVMEAGEVNLTSTHGYGITVEPVYESDPKDYRGTVTVNGGRLTVNSSMGGIALAEEKITIGEKMEYAKGSSLIDSGEIIVARKALTVTKDNFHDYFDESGVLKPTDKPALIFSGDFAGLDVSTITVNQTIEITSDNATFSGISFLITADNVSIDGLTITQTGEYAVKVSGAKGVTLSNNTIHHTKSDTDAAAVSAENADGLKVVGNSVTYTGDASAQKNLPIFVNNSSSVIVSDNSITASIPSVDTEYDSSTWAALPPRSAGAEFIDSAGVRFTGNTLNITSSGENGYYPTVDGIYLSTTDNEEVVITNNNIRIDGLTYVYAINAKAPIYEISDNTVELTSDYYGCALLLHSPVEQAVVQNNSIDVKAKTEAVGIYDTILSENNFGDNSILNNEIVLESESTTGVLLDSWMGSVSGDFLLSENTISAKGNSLCGISLFAAKNAVITGNSVTLQDDTEGDSTGNYTDPEGKRWSCGMITDNATVTGNTVNSTGLGICARNDASVKNNTVYAGYSYAVDVNGGEALVTDNLLMAKTLIGDDAVCNAGIADVHNNTHAHKYVAQTVQPTCTEKGWAADVCSYCGEKTNVTEIAALGHDFGDNEKVCKRCGTANPDYKEPTPTPEPAPEPEAPVLSPEDAALPTVEKTDEEVKKTNTDKKDVVGATYLPLQLKATNKKNNVTLKWKAVKGAEGYIIYGSRCGTKMEKLATVTNAKATSYAFKKLVKGKYYKYIVAAYKTTADGERVITKSKSVHVATDDGKTSNPTGLTVNKKSITLKKGKKATLKAKLKSKKGVMTHIAKFRYESSNPTVAAVDKNGKVKATGKGTATIYVYTQNGIVKTIKVKVK